MCHIFSNAPTNCPCSSSSCSSSSSSGDVRGFQTGEEADLPNRRQDKDHTGSSNSNDNNNHAEPADVTTSNKNSNPTTTTTVPKRQLQKIWLITAGLRGDVQPYVAVCAALKKYGRHTYDVTIFAPDDYRTFIESFGLTFVSLQPSSAIVWESNQQYRLSSVNGNAFGLVRSIGEITKQYAPYMCRTVLERLNDPEQRPDLLLSCTAVNGLGLAISLRYNIPFMKLACFINSYDPRRMHFGLPTLPFGLHYYLLHYLLTPSLYESFKPFDEHFDHVISKRYPKSAFLKYSRNPLLPRLVLVSPHFAKSIHPNKHDTDIFVGTTVIEHTDQCTHIENFGGTMILKRLQHFLSASDTKPIYMGWGSMVSRSREYMVEFCARAIYHSQQRAIVLGGYAKLSFDLLQQNTNLESHILEYVRDNVLFVDSAPHEWLFPRVACTVHHGGAGTTTSALRAGVPTIITPVFIDQYDHAFMVEDLQVGVGFHTKQLQKITWQELGNAIVTVVTNPQIQHNARQLAKQLQQENGAQTSVHEIEKFWDDYCVTDKFIQTFPPSTSPPSSSSCCFTTTSTTTASINIDHGVDDDKDCPIAYSSTKAWVHAKQILTTTALSIGAATVAYTFLNKQLEL